MAIILALLLGDRLGRQLFGIIIYRAVQRISAIFGEQQPRRGFEVRAAVAQIMFERRKAVETFVDRHVGRVLQTGFAHEIPVMDSMTEAALPYLAIVEEAREIDIALLEIDVAVGYPPQPHTGGGSP